MSPLWRVPIDDEWIVFAESREEAEDITAEVVRSSVYDRWRLAVSGHAVPFSGPAPEALMDELPWGDIGPGEPTIAVILSREAKGPATERSEVS